MNLFLKSVKFDCITPLTIYLIRIIPVMHVLLPGPLPGSRTRIGLINIASITKYNYNEHGVMSLNFESMLYKII